jgi:hypothetical protein
MGDIMCEHPQLRIIITIWIPGHREIEGNERADAEAKKAATDSSLSQIFRHKTLNSARVRDIKTAAKDQWQKQWSGGGTKTATMLRRIMKRRGFKARVKFYNRYATKQTNCSDPCSAPDRTLWALPPPVQYREIALCTLNVGKARKQWDTTCWNAASTHNKGRNYERR